MWVAQLILDLGLHNSWESITLGTYMTFNITIKSSLFLQSLGQDAEEYLIRRRGSRPHRRKRKYSPPPSQVPKSYLFLTPTGYLIH